MLGYSEGVYNWLTLIHVLAAIVWVGGGVFAQIYAARLMRANDAARLMGYTRDIERFGSTVFGPSAIVVLISGIVLVWYSPAWSFGQLWVILGLIGIANSIVVGAAFLGAESRRLTHLAEERGSEDLDVQRRARRIFTISRYDLAVLVLVVVDMVVKPGL